MGNAYVCQIVCTDAYENDISLFEKKRDCVKFAEKEAQRYATEYSDGSFLSNQDVSIIQGEEQEITIYVKKMKVKSPPKKRLPKRIQQAMRFFNKKDVKLAKAVNLTYEEMEQLESIEYASCENSGKGDITGGYAEIVITDWEIEGDKKEGDYEEWIYFTISVGDCDSKEVYAECRYDRKNQKVDPEY
jgi:hypothetical protein